MRGNACTWHLFYQPPRFIPKDCGGMRVDHELVSRREAMHVHGTSSVSHPGSFLKTLGGVRLDCELVRSRCSSPQYMMVGCLEFKGAGQGAV